MEKWLPKQARTDFILLMKLLQLRLAEILRRKLAVTWWTNIRFEKVSLNLCLLLKASVVSPFLADSKSLRIAY
jgi:hypothetical protein